MIRIEFALRRKEGMSRRDFQEYWRNTHGPLVSRHSTTLKIHRYIQLHTLDDPINDALAEARGGMEPPYDGVAELWWETPEDLDAFITESGSEAAQELLDDEKKFIDLPNSPLWFAYEYPQVNPTEYMVATQHSPLIKLFFCLRQPNNQSLEECQLYWRTNHGPLIRGVSTGFRMQRYLQVHNCENKMSQALTEARGTIIPPYAGHAEAWFNRADLMMLADVPEASEAMRIAVEDERKFIDFRRSAMWIGKERVFIDRR
ncbi:MAG: EthD domain-containing protein [Pseudomonadota bacterium]|nr:EthD domain-containing protein [Pseudomonadota bacterium]